MSLLDEERGKGRKEGRKEGLREALECFFGVTRAQAHDLIGPIQCFFKAEARDGMSTEERMVEINPANSPEENMAILADALARQRWYASYRENVPGTPPTPASPSVDEGNGGIILDPEGDGQENEVILTRRPDRY